MKTKLISRILKHFELNQQKLKKNIIFRKTDQHRLFCVFFSDLDEVQF